MKERQINSLLRDKILSLDPKGLRSEFFRPDEGIRIYHMGRSALIDLAEEAGALYKVGRSCVIHKGLFDENLERYKVRKEDSNEEGKY